MIRPSACLVPLAMLCCAAAEPQPAAPETHQEFIPVLLELLNQTVQSLAGCTDEASVKAALPRLRELAEQARQLAALQQTLPDPTVQDYMASHPHVAEFNRLWEGICGHIERLEQARLISPELRDLLQVAPPTGRE